jgi:hypothetical protein
MKKKKHKLQKIPAFYTKLGKAVPKAIIQNTKQLEDNTYLLECDYYGGTDFCDKIGMHQQTTNTQDIMDIDSIYYCVAGGAVFFVAERFEQLPFCLLLPKPPIKKPDLIPAN